MKFTVLLCTVATAVSAATYENVAADSGAHYAVFDATWERSHQKAVRKCSKLGYNWRLAQLTGKAEKDLLASKISSPSYIESWNGDKYDGCMNLHPNGAITVALNGCDGPHAFICEKVEEVAAPQY